MRFETESLELIRVAGQKARQMGHAYVGSAHLLLAMAEQRQDPGVILRGFGLNMSLMEDMTAVLYGKGTPKMPLPQGLSGDVRSILRGAAREAGATNSREICPVHVLLAMSRRDRTAAGELLRLSGIDANELFTQTLENMKWETNTAQRRKKEVFSTKLLEQFSEDLIAKASTMEPVIGRDREIEMVIGILCRKN